MKLEVGKFYKNGMGHKCNVFHQNHDGSFLYIDLLTEGVFRVNPYGYHHDGQLSSLISEWVEPVVHEVDVYFWRTIEKQYRASSDPNYWGTPIAKVKVKFTEGDGLS